jgi:glycosyltransferase involved in cell wall biosynthesis
MVDALPLLPGVHAAFVVLDPESPFMRRITQRAEALGVADRIHLLPYVPHDQVVPFLSGADAGVIPIHHWPNHEIALITKFFEYSQARLPLLVSDVRTMAEMTRRTGQGEVFEAKNTPDFARAARLVLADPARYRAAYETHHLLDEWNWARQATRLDEVYSTLVGGAAQ